MGRARSGRRASSFNPHIPLRVTVEVVGEVGTVFHADSGRHYGQLVPLNVLASCTVEPRDNRIAVIVLNFLPLSRCPHFLGEGMEEGI